MSVNPDGALGILGVLATARFDRIMRNTRDPSWQPTSGTSPRYKPHGEIRERQAEVRGAHSTEERGDNLREGRGPAVQARLKQVRARAWPKANHPIDNVRRLQQTLWRSAKCSKNRRFHALYDRISRRDVLWEAWVRVRQNGGTAGVDGVTLSDVKARGAEQLIDELHQELCAKTYKPRPVRVVRIPKANGGERALGIPTVRDRVVQMATTIVVGAIFEADFLPCSYGFRPKKNAHQALERIRTCANAGQNVVIDADIKGYFDTIDHEILMTLVSKRVSDKRVLRLIRQWLHAGVEENGVVRDSTCGVPQGGVISPLLSNIYLHVFDWLWSTKCTHLGTLVRYADDFVVLCRTAYQAREAKKRIDWIMGWLKLTLHPDKTCVVDLARGKGSFKFLGHTIRKCRSVQHASRRLYFALRWPSPKAMLSIRTRLHAMTDVRCGAKDITELIASINPLLRGFGNYFGGSNASRQFHKLDRYVWQRLTRWKIRRRGQRPGAKDVWPVERYYRLGLHRLSGTISYARKPTV